jgi:hypothetical protein
VRTNLPEVPDRIAGMGGQIRRRDRTKLSGRQPVSLAAPSLPDSYNTLYFFVVLPMKNVTNKERPQNALMFLGVLKWALDDPERTEASPQRSDPDSGAYWIPGLV